MFYRSEKINFISFKPFPLPYQMLELIVQF